MRTKRTLIVCAALAVWIAVGWHSPANAFFPFGGYDQFGSLKYIKWSWGMLNDTNNDRDISGPDEGVEIMFEGGPLGWTDAEVEIIKDAFQVWQDVPTSYMGFQFVGVNEDPLYLGLGAGSLAGDLINYVAIEWPDDPITVGVTYPILGVTIYTILIDDSWIGIEDLQWWMTGGQFLEADIIIGGETHRATEPGQEPVGDLLGTMVHEVGHFVGLGHTPMNNIEIVLDDEAGGLYESPAVAVSDASGYRRWVGATPTMFPLTFEVDDGQGGYKSGMADLAPDDIAGISFLYPRGSQSNFFTLSHEARSRTRDGFPSVPLGGGHVVAWCDTDNNPLTRRIPLFSTMTGLYEYYAANCGRFSLYGMYKNIEDPYSSTPIQATYTLTHSPLNQASYDKQSPFAPPNDFSSTGFDSIEGGADVYIDPIWPSEVFHETGNLMGTLSYDVGTVLAFDPQQSTVVSTRTGKSLASMLPSPYPMFGQPNKVCPMNVAVGSLSSQAANQKLRAFRDTVLLRSSLGTLAVDAYYRLSPSMARYLAGHPLALAAARGVVGGANWLVAHAEVLLAAWVTLILAVLWRRRRVRAAALVLIMAGLLLGLPAQALIMRITDEEMVELADDVIIGTVTAVETVEHEVPGLKYLVTNTTIAPTETVKAVVNKNSPLPLSIPGGRKGAVITKVTDFPQFKVGEEVMLYVKFVPKTGTYAILGGNRGTYKVYTDAAGVKYVRAASPESATALDSAAQDIGAKAGEAPAAAPKEEQPPKVLLNDYKKYLRSIANRQKND